MSPSASSILAAEEASMDSDRFQRARRAGDPRGAAPALGYSAIHISGLDEEVPACPVCPPAPEPAAAASRAPCSCGNALSSDEIVCAPCADLAARSPRGPLPTFRPLVAAAAALHLSATLYDGAALVLRDLAPCLPLTDAALCSHLQGAQAAVAGGISALEGLADPAARGRLTTLRQARGAYHRALMAYFGVEVAS